MAAATMALCRSSATHIVARSRSQSRVEPSMSVKRKVMIPEGGAKGMIDVDGTATMTVQSTKSRQGQDDDKAVRCSPFSRSQRSCQPMADPTMWQPERTFRLCTYREPQSQNW